MKNLEQNLRDFLDKPTCPVFEEISNNHVCLVLIAQKMLKEGLEEKLDAYFEPRHWKIVHNNSSGELQKFALRKIKNFKKSFQEWRELHSKSSIDSELKELYLTKMKEVANSFEQWQIIWYIFDKFEYKTNKYKQRCSLLDKIRKTKNGFHGWYIIYKNSLGKLVEITDISLKKMEETAKHFSEWDIIRSFSTEKRRKVALKKMGKVANNFEEWKTIHDHSFGRTRRIALKKMTKIAKRFEEWEIIHDNSSGRAREIAFKEMEKILSFKLESLKSP